MTTIIIIAGLIMIAGAFAVIFAKSVKLAIIIFGVVSLFASVMFFLMKAPDVAITEASIGAVLTTAAFFWATRRVDESGDKK